MATILRIIIIVLDSVGIGGLPDAKAYNDEGANTIGNLYRAMGYLKKNLDLAIRETFADCGQTISDLLGLEPLRCGRSFKKDILDDCL